MSSARIESLPAAERRRLVAFGLVRALAITVVVIAVYYLLPLNNLAGISLGVALAVGLLVLTAVVAYQVRAIIRHRHSAVRAVAGKQLRCPASSPRCSAQANINHALRRGFRGLGLS